MIRPLNYPKLTNVGNGLIKLCYPNDICGNFDFDGLHEGCYYLNGMKHEGYSTGNIDDDYKLAFKLGVLVQDLPNKYNGEDLIGYIEGKVDDKPKE